MRYEIIKFTDDDTISVGYLSIDAEGAIAIDSEDTYLKNWVEELSGEEITISEGIGDVNDIGHPVRVEISRTVTPKDVDFIYGLQESFPPDYFIAATLDNERLKLKTA